MCNAEDKLKEIYNWLDKNAHYVYMQLQEEQIKKLSNEAGIHQSREGKNPAKDYYNKQTISFTTDEGTARSEKDFINCWKERMKSFPHYKVAYFKFQKGEGKEI